MSYNIKLEDFEGPLDLLLYLIKRSKVNINDISVADITYQYMEYISHAEALNMDLTSEFLVTAAELIEIKSRSLLPAQPKAVQETQEEEMDPEQRLKERLQIYNLYKEAASKLRAMEIQQETVFTGPQRYKQRPEPLIVIEIKATVEDLFNCYHRIINKIKPMQPYSIKPETISLNKQINMLKRMLRLFEYIRFSHIVARYRRNKAQIVVSFISVLELMKLGEAEVHQSKPLTDIVIRRVKY